MATPTPAAQRDVLPARRHSERIGDRLPPRAGPIRRLWHFNGLSLVLLALFAASLVGQVWTGWQTYNGERQNHGRAAVSLRGYLGTGHFGEATFENFESEFLQMACYVLLTVYLYQRGSAESKRPDVLEAVDLNPAHSPAKADAPWPVRRGGLVLRLYENSLSIAFALCFAVSFGLHGRTGLVQYNEERVAHGEAEVSVREYMSSPEFWFESFQNWQSEFLSLAAMVTFTIFLRQRGSPESKPVDAPTWDTGH